MSFCWWRTGVIIVAALSTCPVVRNLTSQLFSPREQPPPTHPLNYKQGASVTPFCWWRTGVRIGAASSTCRGLRSARVLLLPGPAPAPAAPGLSVRGLCWNRSLCFTDRAWPVSIIEPYIWRSFLELFFYYYLLATHQNSHFFCPWTLLWRPHQG